MPGKRGGYRPGSGRKKKPARVVSEALDKVRDRLPEIFASLTEKAASGDKDAAIYLIDRILGKPKQQIAAQVDPGEYLQKRDIAMIARQAEFKTIELLKDATGVYLMST